MYHYTYKISSLSGKFYVGRHSTQNLDDNYLGSGKWVRSILDKSILEKEILCFYDSYEELILAEKLLIEENIDSPMCMNFNSSPVGFSSGALNPSKNTDIRAATSQRMKISNPSSRPEVRDKISTAQKGVHRKGHKQSEETKAKISEARLGFRMLESQRLELSEKRKKQCESGLRKPPTFAGNKHREETIVLLAQKARERKSIVCEFCNISFKPHTYSRWHGSKCKFKCE